MSEINIRCNFCDAGIMSATVSEAVKWSDAHEEVCPANGVPRD